ncbi:type IV toxin-antitoxin system AbiEi family antitoxin [uncultured Adlercreutzia sp.]|uniref:type IV toxin-antitoxin system AbiEi family antitoxin n=1 Tax=uncultured Adlercreutzia sp. TaxID=875803 RepID=UPI0026F3CF30|nr:type IV toxin-antitoxin system AbiEi family antitoxin [uncultured Adlercreutzia sp.]
MAKVITRLEKDEASIVTLEYLASILDELDIRTPVTVFAARMKEKGWLEATRMRGVWRFLRAESDDPSVLFDAKAFALLHKDEPFALAGETALWKLGYSLADPVFIDVCFPKVVPRLVMPSSFRPHVFEAALPLCKEKEFSCLCLESAFVDIAAKPQIVGAWDKAVEWLPCVSADLEWEGITRELEDRPASVAARTGYLLQGVRPDLAVRIMRAFPPKGKARFGPRAASLRNDAVWQIADTLLSFDPRLLGARTGR